MFGAIQLRENTFSCLDGLRRKENVYGGGRKIWMVQNALLYLLLNKLEMAYNYDLSKTAKKYYWRIPR